MLHDTKLTEKSCTTNARKRARTWAWSIGLWTIGTQPIFRTSGQLDLGLDTLFFQTQFGQIRRLGQW